VDFGKIRTLGVRFEKLKSLSQKLTVVSNTPAAERLMLVNAIGVGFGPTIVLYDGDIDVRSM
jgi:hypothetical protein